MAVKNLTAITTRIEKVFRVQEEVSPGFISEVRYEQVSEILKKLEKSEIPGHVYWVGLTGKEAALVRKILEEFDARLPKDFEESFDIAFFSIEGSSVSSADDKFPLESKNITSHDDLSKEI